MKRILLVFGIFAVSLTSLKAQNNIGIFAGGGLSVPFIRYHGYTNSTAPDSFGIKPGYRFEIASKAYHFGFNFENVLVERMLYLQFGLQAMSKGYRYSDSIYVYANGIHIPLDMKYKYFFSKRGENFVSANLGFYVAAYYNGIDYDKRILDQMIANHDTVGLMNYDPQIKFGKIMLDDQAEMSTFDYGINGGLGIGLFGHLQINYNFGWSANIYKYELWDNNVDGISLDFNAFYYRNTFHTLTAAFYFTNK